MMLCMQPWNLPMAAIIDFVNFEFSQTLDTEKESIPDALGIPQALDSSASVRTNVFLAYPILLAALPL